MYIYCIPARLLTNTTPPTTAPTTRQDTATREPIKTILGFPAELTSFVLVYDAGEGEVASPVEEIYNNAIPFNVTIHKTIANEHSHIPVSDQSTCMAQKDITK